MNEVATFFDAGQKQLGEIKLPFGHRSHLHLSLAGRIPQNTFRIKIDKYVEYVYGNRETILKVLKSEFSESPHLFEEFSLEMPNTDSVSMYLLVLARCALNFKDSRLNAEAVLRVPDEPYDPDREKESLRVLNRNVILLPTEHVISLSFGTEGLEGEVYDVLPNGDLVVSVYDKIKCKEKGSHILKRVDVELIEEEYRWDKIKK